MRIQTQPNRWSCTLVAYAMALNIDWQELIKETEHDGSEVWWPELQEPQRRRGFHFQEFFHSVMKRGYAPVVLEEDVAAVPFSNQDYTTEDIRFSDANIRFLDYLFQHHGVIMGLGRKKTYHAVAWDTHDIYDPNGTIYGIEEFTVKMFIMFVPILGSITSD